MMIAPRQAAWRALLCWLAVSFSGDASNAANLAPKEGFLWDPLQIASDSREIDLDGVTTLEDAIHAFDDHDLKSTTLHPLSAEWFFRTGVRLNSRFEKSDLCLRCMQAAWRLTNDNQTSDLDRDRDSTSRVIRRTAVEVALRAFTRTVGQARSVSIQTGVGSDGRPFTLAWLLGDDLRDVADKACCLGVDDPAQVCVEHHDPNAGEDACSAHVYRILLHAEERLRPPAISKGRPPRYIPEEQYEAYTDDYQVLIFHMYRDDSVAGFYRGFSKPYLEAMQAMAEEERDGVNYPDVDRLLYKLLREPAAPGTLRAALAGVQVGIIGSAVPWYEMLALAYGAASCFTIEYNTLEHQHPLLATVTPDEYWRLSPRPRFPVALSISSLEHDGLGRYGDALNPEGDVEAIRGLLVLAVPVAADALVWNCHRIYGRRRLTKLLLRWTVERVEGLTAAMFDTPLITPPQPVFLLRNTRPSAPTNFTDVDDPIWAMLP